MEIEESEYQYTLEDINESDDNNMIEDFNNLSVDEQNNFNNNLIKAFKSKEIKKTFISIFDSYFQSNKTNLKNANAGKLKRTSMINSDLDEDIIEEEDYFFEKENTNGEKKKLQKKNQTKKIEKFQKIKIFLKVSKKIIKSLQVNILLKMKMEI